MNITKTIFILLLLLHTQLIYAKKSDSSSFLLQADDSTSFMNYEFHSLAFEAAQKKDFENAYRIYRKLADKGDDRAEYNIGILYMKGKGVERKKMDGYKWLRRASKHGNKEAHLYFKKMNDKYATKTLKKRSPIPKVEKTDVPKKVKEDLVPKILVIEPVIEPMEEVILPIPVIKKQEDKEDFSSYLLYLALFLVLIGVLFFFKKGKKEPLDKEVKKSTQSTPKYKSQIFDIVYSHVKDYHSALLKQIDLAQIKADKDQTQIYYMFINGAIDFYCQLEKLSDSQQRRIFTSHISQVEGKENLTAITQSILEGQKNSTLYHFQAAGGISAQEWHEHKSDDALSMLKKVLIETRH
ncbi:sel1 repeat family protein [Sulfurimonas sp. MAG313]|nr:tetratricopeptide repeat protein [Sulfurimonas sp. MAG313]MDF1881224.1 sel1 repeat family protein [Sulfurimonas sp. MAG313]